MNAPAKRFDILAVGYACIDYIVCVDHLPRLDEKITAESLLIQGGGLAATAMVAAARLGGATALVAPLAEDEIGRRIIAELEDENVDISLSPLRKRGQSAFAFVMIEKSSGLRTIVGRGPTAAPLTAGDIAAADIAAARVLFIDGTVPDAQKAAARAAREVGVPVIIDAEGQGGAVTDLAALSDVVIGSREFARTAGRSDDPAAAARAIFERFGCRVAGVTAGAQGSFFHTSGGAFHQRAYQVEVADTTGAGDAFHGAYAFGMARGRPPRDCARLAAAVAAMKCRRFGGRSGLPGLAAVCEFLAERGESLPVE